VQYWHDLAALPGDVEECIASWKRWSSCGITHSLFDERGAKAFIHDMLGPRHAHAFMRCYHPAMQADYFRLCYLLVEGGMYVDADDVCIGQDIDALFVGGLLKVQPLCYNRASSTMVESSAFLPVDANNPDWIFYFNNNPLIAGLGHPIVQRALGRATALLELSQEPALPEIQETTGPGNLSECIFEHALALSDIEKELVVLRDWSSLAISKWPLSYRGDARNWRLSNGQRLRHRGEQPR
jgi:mannosyltransferase OCH1-like enzyme